MLSLRLYGLFARSLFRPTTAPGTMRARFERFGRVEREPLRRKHPELSFEDHRAGTLHIEAVRATRAPRCAIVHLHGGAFVFGSSSSYRNRAMRLSYRCDAELFVPDYRLAPEHPFPAALDDALAAVQYVSAARPGVPLFVTGDSAGGGLVLSVLVRLRELAAPMPCGAILLSPWTDLSVSGASVDRNRAKDLWLSRAHLERWAAHYAGAADRRDPRLSPAFADLSALPRLLVLVGEDEVLFDDAHRVVSAATRAGTPARLLVGAGMQHDWPLTLPWLEESRDAWKQMTAFVADQCAGPRTHSPEIDPASVPWL